MKEKTQAQWREALLSANNDHLSDIDVINNEILLDEFMVAMDSYLTKTAKEQFWVFLHNSLYSYVPTIIKERTQRNDGYRQSYILLTYFLVRKYRITMYLKWPFDMKILEGIYSDLGISCEHIST